MIYSNVEIPLIVSKQLIRASSIYLKFSVLLMLTLEETTPITLYLAIYVCYTNNGPLFLCLVLLSIYCFLSVFIYLFIYLNVNYVCINIGCI